MSLSEESSLNVKKWISGIIFVALISIYAVAQTRDVLVPFLKSPLTLKNAIHVKMQQIQNVMKGDSSRMEGDKSVPPETWYFGVVDAEMGWTPYMDIIDEKTALKDPPFTDIKKGVCINNSKVDIQDKTRIYNVGDTIRVRIDLYDCYGNHRQRGGDQLRVRIFEQSRKASASGYVVDHENGSYTAIVRCLWVGSPTILVYMSYSREAVRALYYTRKTLLSTRNTYVLYTNGESQPCHAFKAKLGGTTQSCDMTSLNGNMSWYCRAPANEKCTMANFFLKFPYPKLPVTPAESVLFKRNMEHLVPSLNIKVSGNRQTRHSTHKKPPCATFNRTKLWFQPSPIGHFMNNKWEPVHCSVPPGERFESCLRNKHLLFYGDSTIRQWFVNLMRRYKCSLSSEHWTQDKWKKDSAAFCANMNLTLEWIVHAFPGNIDKTRTNIHSIAGNMLNFANNKNAIFVIHLLCHLSAYHHDVFRDRISHIRKSVDAVLESNKDAKILIKGGHTFRDFGQVSDYYSYVYRTIEIEEFKGRYDKVIYLDNKDMTNAKEVIPNHPNEIVVTEMVNQMLSYICD